MQIDYFTLLQLAEQHFSRKGYAVSYDYKNFEKPTLLVGMKHHFGAHSKLVPVVLLEAGQSLHFALRHKELHPFHMFWAELLPDGTYETHTIPSCAYIQEETHQM